MADGARTPDYARMARGELIRRLEHARRWGRETLASNRALAKQVEDLAAEVDDLRDRLTELERSIERAGQALGNILDELEMGMIGEDEGGWDLAQRIRDDIGDDLELGPGWGAELVEADKLLRSTSVEDLHSSPSMDSRSLAFDPPSYRERGSLLPEKRADAPAAPASSPVDRQ